MMPPPPFHTSKRTVPMYSFPYVVMDKSDNFIGAFRDCRMAVQCADGFSIAAMLSIREFYPTTIIIVHNTPHREAQ